MQVLKLDKQRQPEGLIPVLEALLDKAHKGEIVAFQIAAVKRDEAVIFGQSAKTGIYCALLLGAITRAQVQIANLWGLSPRFGIYC